MSVARACKQCQERIRELEAGLLGCRQARSELEWECGRLAQLANEATARAEKAEAERETWIASVEAANRARKAYRDEKARVAELVRELSKFAPIRYEEMIEDGLIEREAD